MRAFNHFLNTARAVLPWAQDAIERDDFHLRRNGEKVAFDIDASDEVMRQIADLGQLQLMQTYILFELIRSGPKVLNVPERYVGPLLNTDINITIADYNQPFKFMCVNLPPCFVENYVASYENDLFGNGPGKHSPECVLVCHDDETDSIIVNVIFTSNQSVTALFNRTNDIESQISVSMDARLDGSADMDKSEAITAGAAIKIALNAMLLADGQLTPLGPSNKEYFEKLQRQNKKQGTAAQMEATRAALLTHPFIYEIDQNVQTYNKSEPNDPTGTRGGNKPHWRRGHYRMQRIGKDLQESKRVRIPPVLVNAHLFLGNPLDTRVNYELNTPIQETSAK